MDLGVINKIHMLSEDEKQFFCPSQVLQNFFTGMIWSHVQGDCNRFDPTQPANLDKFLQRAPMGFEGFQLERELSPERWMATHLKSESVKSVKGGGIKSKVATHLLPTFANQHCCSKILPIQIGEDLL